jgi:hypothetical protein
MLAGMFINAQLRYLIFLLKQYVKNVKVQFRIGALQHRSLKAYCALTPKEFLHLSLEALHTKRHAAPQLPKAGTV